MNTRTPTGQAPMVRLMVFRPALSSLLRLFDLAWQLPLNTRFPNPRNYIYGDLAVALYRLKSLSAVTERSHGT